MVKAYVGLAVVYVRNVRRYKLCRSSCTGVGVGGVPLEKPGPDVPPAVKMGYIHSLPLA